MVNTSLGDDKRADLAVPLLSHRRTYWYVGAVVLCAGLVALAAPNWRSGPALHTLLESSGALLALVVGTLGFARYAAHRSSITLVLAAGFVGVGLLDAYHAAVSTPFAAAHWPREVVAIVTPWSGLAARTYLAVMLFATWFLWFRWDAWGKAPRLNPRWVFGVCGGVVLTVLLGFTFGAPAIDWRPSGQPIAAGGAVVFGVALIGYLAKGAWRDNHFEHWLVIALIANSFGQIMFAFGTRQPFDAGFDVAHLLKTAGYACVFVGSAFDIHASFKQERRATAALRAEARAHNGVIAELRASHERYRDLYENAPHAYVSADAFSGRILRFNRKLPELTGHTAEELAQMNAADLYVDPDFPKRLAQEVSAGRTVDDIETQLRRRDGQVRWVNITLAPLYDAHGTVFERRAIIVDVDERVRFEASLAARTAELERSNAELDRFASVASHDLQEPLRKVRTFADRLRDNQRAQLDARGQEYLDRLCSAAERMQNLISDLLSYSRVTTKASPFSRVDLNAIVGDVLIDLEIAIEDTAAHVVVDALPTIDADALQMRLLMQNLLANALKYHAEGTTPEVRVTARDLDAAVEIQVIDNGIGFDDKHQERIFEIFQRLHGREAYAGTGVGLAICRKIAERHRGSIHAAGTPGAGAVFTVQLPKHQAAETTHG